MKCQVPPARGSGFSPHSRRARSVRIRAGGYRKKRPSQRTAFFLLPRSDSPCGARHPVSPLQAASLADAAFHGGFSPHSRRARSVRIRAGVIAKKKTVPKDGLFFAPPLGFEPRTQWLTGCNSFITTCHHMALIVIIVSKCSAVNSMAWHRLL
jgi:hypothetical protein